MLYLYETGGTLPDVIGWKVKHFKNMERAVQSKFAGASVMESAPPYSGKRGVFGMPKYAMPDEDGTETLLQVKVFSSTGKRRRLLISARLIRIICQMCYNA